jgi:hypothetical protein
MKMIGKKTTMKMLILTLTIMVILKQKFLVKPPVVVKLNQKQTLRLGVRLNQNQK